MLLGHAWSRTSQGDMQLDFLNAAELQEITGYRQPAFQITWLKEQRWHHTVTVQGDPKVARRYAEMKYGLAGDIKPGATTQPDWSA